MWRGGCWREEGSRGWEGCRRSCERERREEVESGSRDAEEIERRSIGGREVPSALDDEPRRLIGYLKEMVVVHEAEKRRVKSAGVANENETRRPKDVPNQSFRREVWKRKTCQLDDLGQ